MKASGHIAFHSPSDRDDSIAAALTEKELELLDEAYQNMLPQYKELCQQYNRAEQQARNARLKSTFPQRRNWQPLNLLENDRFMLQGPKNEVETKSRLCCFVDGREVVYSTEEREKCDGRHLWSCVHVVADRICSTPEIGQIVKIFCHKFGENTHIIATINFIEPDAMEQDNDSGLWFAKKDYRNITKIFPIKQLSPPLVIANEHTKIWFLDIIIPHAAVIYIWVEVWEWLNILNAQAHQQSHRTQVVFLSLLQWWMKLWCG